MGHTHVPPGGSGPGALPRKGSRGKSNKMMTKNGRNEGHQQISPHPKIMMVHKKNEITERQHFGGAICLSKDRELLHRGILY